MENQYQQRNDGQEVQQQDLTIVASEAALVDDRLLWEFLRVLPNGGATQKVVLPSGLQGGGKYGLALHNGSAALVCGETADGAVHVAPFRAIVGSQTLFATSHIEALRGQRSGFLVGGANLWTDVALSGNSSSNPRWTLIYATVTINATGTTAPRYVKDPATGWVSRQTLPLTQTVSIVLTARDGATGASPVRPSLPADSATQFNIALAYVWVPAGFTAGSSSVARGSIYECFPPALFSRATGARVLAPADQQYAVGGTVDTRQSGASSSTRTGAYLPPSMLGGATRLIAISLSGFPSHADGDVVDNSIDWRNRFFAWEAFASDSSIKIASDRAASTGVQLAPSAFMAATLVSSPFTYYPYIAHGMGQSFVDDKSFFNALVDGSSNHSFALTDCNGVAMFGYNPQTLNNPPTPPGNTSMLIKIGTTYAGILLQVRASDGALIFKKSQTGVAQGSVVIWLDATGQYANFGNV